MAAGIADLVSVVEPWAGGVLCFESPGCWANHAQGVGLMDPVSDAELDYLVEFYSSRGCEPTAELCPFAHQSLVDGLAARRFELRHFENVFVRELVAGEDMMASLPHGWPEGLEIVPVEPGDAAMLSTFVDVSISGFLEPGEQVTRAMIETAERLAAHPRNDCYLARVDGEVVGACSMETAGPIASVFFVSVLPPYRRRGIQQAMIVRRLERARERGAELVTMHSKPGIATERNAARLGFAMGYTRVVLARKAEGLVPSQ